MTDRWIKCIPKFPSNFVAGDKKLRVKSISFIVK